MTRGKGFPDIYYLAAEKIGLFPENCAVFEDILKGIEGAKIGGFLAIGVEDLHSAFEKEFILEYGYYFLFFCSASRRIKCREQ